MQLMKLGIDSECYNQSSRMISDDFDEVVSSEESNSNKVIPIEFRSAKYYHLYWRKDYQMKMKTNIMSDEEIILKDPKKKSISGKHLVSLTKDSHTAQCIWNPFDVKNLYEILI